MRTGTAEVASVPSRDDGRNIKIGKNVEALGGTKELVSTNVLGKQCCIRQRHTASPGIHDDLLSCEYILRVPFVCYFKANCDTKMFNFCVFPY